MSRQYVDFTVAGGTTDTGEQDNTAIQPLADGEPAQASVLKRPSENLRTRTEFIRSAVDDSKYLNDADRAMLLTGTGSITWAGLPTGTFTSSANITLKPFTAPNASAASRLLICAGTQAQITFRTRQDGLSGQPRAYSGANTISFDFTPVTTGTGAIVVTADGTPANNVHIQYDDHAVSGTTVDQIPANSMVHQFNISSVAISLGLEAVVEGTGSPTEVGFPSPPASVAASLIKDYISGPEQLTRYMAGAADAEKHIVSPAQFVTFFADPLNQLIEGDVIGIRYDSLVMGGNGGRRQSINENPENKANDAGLNLFLMRRFPDRLPGSLPLCAVVDGVLIWVNNRSFASGEAGPIVSAGASYQGSPTPPNSWADGTAVSGPISFETALDTIIQTLGTKAGGTPGAIKVGFTPSGNIAANTVKGALEELDSEKAGLALPNTFTRAQVITPSVATETALTATGNTTGGGLKGTGGATNGLGVEGVGGGSGGVGGKFTGSTTGAAMVAVPGASGKALDAGSGKIVSLAGPSAGSDAANKTYVDGSTAGFAATITADKLFESIMPPGSEAVTMDVAAMDLANFIAYNGTVGRFSALGMGRFFIGGTLAGAPVLLYTDDGGGSMNNAASSSYATAMNTHTPETMSFNTGNTLAVSTSNTGDIATSPSPFTVWTARTSGTAQSLTEVYWNNADSEWVAAGTAGTLLTSPDGVTWTSNPAGIGSSSIRTAYSPDFGITLAASDNGASSTVLAKSAFPGGGVWTTTTFTPWTATNTIKQLDFIPFPSSAGVFVAVTNRGGVYTSDSGGLPPTWTTIVSPDLSFTGYFASKVVWNGTYAMITIGCSDTVQNFTVIFASGTSAIVVPGIQAASNIIQGEYPAILGAYGSTWWVGNDAGGVGITTKLIIRPF